MPGQKIIGLVLLIIGVGIILYTLWFSFNIFTAKSAPPEIFKTANSDNNKGSSNNLNIQGLEINLDQLGIEQLQQQVGSIIPPNAVSRLLNLISWSILAGIFIFGGSHIAGIGINLIRK